MLTKQTQRIITNRIIILLLFLIPIISVAQRSGQLYAVCVGVSEYQLTSSNLKYPNEDAKEVYELLKLHTAQSNLRLLTDSRATAENVLATLNEMFTKTRPEDIVIFFFGGHGMQGGFCAYDQQIRFRSLQTVFKKTKARRKVIFADACYAGTLRTPDKSGSSNESHAGEDVLLFLSSRSNQESIESYGLGNGIFTYFLLSGLQGAADANSDNIIAAKELFIFVNAKVRTYSQNQQTPVMWGKFDDNMPVLDWNKKR
ncbi:MAG: caspase family protein [Prevotellaceae bacterium]|nr:caspase family protein [Prevotellaceae bacterium]